MPTKSRSLPTMSDHCRPFPNVPERCRPFPNVTERNRTLLSVDERYRTFPNLAKRCRTFQNFAEHCRQFPNVACMLDIYLLSSFQRSVSACNLCVRTINETSQYKRSFLALQKTLHHFKGPNCISFYRDILFLEFFAPFDRFKRSMAPLCSILIRFSVSIRLHSVQQHPSMSYPCSLAQSLCDSDV